VRAFGRIPQRKIRERAALAKRRVRRSLLLGSEPRHCPRCGEKVQAETGRRAVNSTLRGRAGMIARF